MSYRVVALRAQRQIAGSVQSQDGRGAGEGAQGWALGVSGDGPRELVWGEGECGVGGPSGSRGT